MNGIPEGETFAFLLGRRLDQVRLTSDHLGLYFDGGVSAIVHGHIGVRPPSGAEHVSADARAIIETLVGALSLDVAEAEVANGSGFSLTFEDGTCVRLIDSEPSRESFRITDGNTWIVV